jgi:hypothetical protein
MGKIRRSRLVCLPIHILTALMVTCTGVGLSAKEKPGAGSFAQGTSTRSVYKGPADDGAGQVSRDRHARPSMRRPSRWTSGSA